jgi:predicted O-methyltransferase YrrM
VDLADCLETELSFATTLFDDGTFAGYSALSLALKVSDKLIQRLAATFSDAEQELAKVDSWESLRPIIVNADIMECVQEHMQKGFMQLIKVKELPVKKAWGDILLRSQ